MKTLKYIILGVILSSLIFSSFSFQPSGNHERQPEKVTFWTTYTQQEVLSRLDQDDQLFRWIRLEDTDPGSSRIGRCHQNNLDDLWKYVRSQTFRSMVQEDLFIYPGTEAKDQMISLYAIRKDEASAVFPSHEDVKKVSVIKEETGENYSLLISFSHAGAEKWASITRLNRDRDLAMLYKGEVISAPRVREEITGGKCSISGSYTESEIMELKAVFED